MSKPAVMSLDKFVLFLIGATTVRGPGQNLFARRRVSLLKTANFCAVSKFRNAQLVG